jgi:DNA invertase Pin-like site-specific DNA recombinase
VKPALLWATLPADRQRQAQQLLGRLLERLAFVYIRQSDPQQIVKNPESTARQYALADLAVALGWPRDRVEVIDDDQGKTAATAEGRVGFHYLLGEVALGHAGIILGTEVSRPARCCKDWYQLMELCARFGTLLGDSDGLYDPGHYNDRLLLGLKSSSPYCTGNYTSATGGFPEARPQPRLRAT